MKFVSHMVFDRAKKFDYINMTVSWIHTKN